ncbi:MAG: hypothetical protein JNL43_05300 [Flavobacteriales bacterium]|nr:hypothetical protein [Flavobacteriales bacterium]
MSLRHLASIPLLLVSVVAPAQFYNWGWGPEISVNQIGSTITCTVWDPYLNTTRTQSFTSVASWSHDDGVVATVSGGGVVTAIVYDLDLASFRTEQLTSTSGTTVINSDGIVAWKTGSGIVGAAIYDPDAHTWRDEQFSSNSGNQIQNRDGVVSWVSSSGIMGAAVYDPGVSQWQDEQFSSNSGNVVQNRDGIVAWVSTSGILGAAVYDPSVGQWIDEQFSSNTGNAVVIGQGVVAWKSNSGVLGGAAYNWTTNTWDDSQFSSSSSNTMPTITDGTIQWSNSSGAQRYGYTTSGQWQSNVNTAVRCEYHAEQVSSGGAPHIAYLWCLTIGASSYSHSCGDGHTITRRWAWKQYANGGTYTPTLTAFSATTNNTCSGSVSYVNTGLEDPTSGTSFTVSYQDDLIRVTGDAPLGLIEVLDASGRSVVSARTTDRTLELPGAFATGLYLVRCYGSGEAAPTRRLVVER